MKNWLLLVAALGASIVACGPPPPPGSCQASAAGNAYCIDYSGAGATMSTVMSRCSMAMGTYSATACATTGRVGRCAVVLPGGVNITQTANYYAPTTVDVARMACEAQMGTFTAD